MRSNKFPSEHYFYWLAFFVALLLRLYKLGIAPLADAEATWALQALGLARGTSHVLGAQPAYIILTSLLFSLLGSTNFLARLFPAIAGSLLVWLPYSLRGWMGESTWLRRAGLVMAFGLAIDPGLVSISRQAGSQMPALAFTLLALSAFFNRRMAWAGLFAGLALLSGPAFLQGLLILAVSWGIYRLVIRKPAATASGEDQAEPPAESPPAPSLVKSLPAFALTLLVAGTLLLRAPQGLAGLADTLPAYLKTWLTPSGIPALRLPAAILVYQPLVFIIAVAALARTWLAPQDPPLARQVVFGLSIWAGVAILLPLAYAGRQVADLSWCLIPLWALASFEISRALQPEADKTTRIVAACLALLLMVMAIVGWLNFLALLRFQTNIPLYWASIVAAFLLGLIAVLLVAAGWSKSAAIRGVVVSLCAVLALQLLSSGLNMTIARRNGTQDLWSQPPATAQADQLIATLSDLSSRNTGLRDQLEIVALAGSPSLEWVLRTFPNARFEVALSPSESPAVVITLKGSQEPVLAQKYRGQDFVWSLSPGWQGAAPADVLSWLAYRSAPLAQSQVILWARVDMFPGGTSGAGVAPEGTGITTP